MKKIIFLSSLVAIFFLTGCNQKTMNMQATIDNTAKQKKEIFCAVNNQNREINNGKSSITDEANCDVKNYNPEQDCLITKYLEEKTITGSKFGGVNFCTYTFLGQEDLTKYIVPICDEYYIVDYKLECENSEKKVECKNIGNGSGVYVYDNFEREILNDSLINDLKKCDLSCKYVELKNKTLNTGGGYSLGIAKITIDQNGNIDYWSPDLAHKTEGDEYLLKNIPEKYLEKAKNYNNHSELSNWNQKRAEDYFCLKYDEKMIYDY